MLKMILDVLLSKQNFDIQNDDSIAELINN